MDRKTKEFPALGVSPIVEATCQVNFALEKPLTREEAKDLATRFFPEFKHNGDIFSESIAVEKKDPSKPPTQIRHQQNWTGVRFIRGSRVITIFQDGLAYGIMSPYPNDDSFFDEVINTMKIAEEKIPDKAITRIGLRFINRLPVGEGRCGRLKDVLVTLPETPQKIGEAEPARFLYQDCFFDRKTGVSTVVNRVYPANDPSAPNKPMIILDIDSFVTPQKCLATEEFEASLDMLRTAVNTMFFGSVGDKMMEVFK